MRNKIVTLFNKNHVTITKTITDKAVEVNYFEEINKSSLPTTVPPSTKRVWVPKGKEVIEKKSPLGFYYKQTRIWDGHYETKVINPGFNNKEGNFEWRHYRIWIGKVHYDIVYPRSYGSIKINKDARPWDIADGGMEDHFVNDLFKITDELIEIIKDAKVQWKPKERNWWRDNSDEEYWKPWSLADWKLNLYEDLYGNKKGPRYMTNDEKILAHGFDLKTSFRKM